MSHDSYLLDSKDKKEKPASRWFGRLLKLTFVFLAFILVILTVLANMGGSNDMLREGVGRTVSGIFGARPVKIGELIHMGFFPTVALDVKDINVYAKPNDVIPLVKINKFHAYMPFWNVATKTPRLTSLYMEGFHAIKGVYIPEEIFVEKAFIDHDVEAGTAKLRGNGRVGVHTWDVEAGLEVSGSKGKYGYMLSRNSKIVFDIADLHFETNLIRGDSRFIKLENFDLTFGEKRIAGNLVMSALGRKLLKVKGDLKTRDDRTILLPDVIVNFLDTQKMDISGKVISEKFVIDDFIGDSSVYKIFSRIREIVGHGAIPRRKDGTLALLGSNNINIDFDFKNVDVNGQLSESLKFNVVQNDGRIKIGPVLGVGGMVMPAVMALYNQEEEILVSIIQDGRVDMKFAQAWLKNLPKHILKQESIDVECGIGKFSENLDSVDIMSFGVKTKSRSFGVKEKNIPHNKMFFDLHFIETKGQVKLEELALPKPLYDFVQGSFQKSNEGSACSAFVTQTKSKQTENEPQVPEQDSQ